MSKYLTVLTFVNYAPSDSGCSGSQLVRILKGRKYNSDCSSHTHLNVGNQQEIFEWFGEIASLFFRTNVPFSLIPIPDSDSCLASKVIPRTRFLADALAKYRRRAIVLDVLRWRKNMRAAHKGGIRDPYRLMKALEITQRELPSIPYVLVDDVITTGGHLIACANKLEEYGASCEYALCVARAVRSSQEKQFAIIENRLYIGHRRFLSNEFNASSGINVSVPARYSLPFAA